MKNSVHVAIVGESVLADGIAVMLESDPRNKVLHLPDGEQALLAELVDFRPAVVIFPLDRPDLEAVLSQMRSETGVRFVGYDVDCSQALVIDSRIHSALSMESLKALIDEQSNGLPGSFSAAD